MELIMNREASQRAVGQGGECEGWRRLPWSRTPLLRRGLVALPRRSGESAAPAPPRQHPPRPPPVDERPSQAELIRINLM